MSWFRISFDGDGLAYAKMTRHDREGTVFLRPGRPVHGSRTTIYPTVARLEGFSRIQRDQMVAMLRQQYGNAQAGTDGETIAVDMPADRLWADALTHLRGFEDLFGTPYIRLHGGWVEVTVASETDLSDASIQGRLQAAAKDADVTILPNFDVAPWDGLRPRLLASIV